jgi:hypothetical protein
MVSSNDQSNACQELIGWAVIFYLIVTYFTYPLSQSIVALIFGHGQDVAKLLPWQKLIVIPFWIVTTGLTTLVILLYLRLMVGFLSRANVLFAPVVGIMAILWLLAKSFHLWMVGLGIVYFAFGIFCTIRFLKKSNDFKALESEPIIDDPILESLRSIPKNMQGFLPDIYQQKLSEPAKRKARKETTRKEMAVWGFNSLTTFVIGVVMIVMGLMKHLNRW